MRSWTNWKSLNGENVREIPQDATGVYAIRAKSLHDDPESDIICIGCSGVGNVQGLRQRLRRLLNAQDHTAAPCVHTYGEDDLELSWLKCSQAPDGVEKALLLAFWTSVGRLPRCNNRF